MTGIRAALVIAFSALVLATTLPNVMLPSMTGDLGFALSPDNKIEGIEPNSAASRAGLRAGDLIDPSRNSVRERNLFPAGVLFPNVGQRLTIYVLRNSAVRPVSVTAQENSGYYFVLLAKRLTGLVFVVVGTMLLLMRPSRMTWGFYLYAVGNNAGTPVLFSFLPPAQFFALDALVEGVPGALAPVGLLIFALRFPSGRAIGWRKAVDRFVPLLALPLIFFALYPLFAWEFEARTSLAFALWTTYPAAILLTVSFLIVLATYFKTSGIERQRISWVIAGLTLSYTGNMLASQIAFYVVWPYGITPDAFRVLNVGVPLTVAYCIIRHRILDINFVINRALVYGGITLVIVLIFTLIDWFFTRTLSSKLGLVADIGAALIIGVTLDRLHQRIDHFMDSVFFRRRHVAEVRLKCIAGALPHAASTDAVDAALVEEPTDWLQLASAAIFRRDGANRYIRRMALGWSEVMCEELTTDDRLVMQLDAQQTTLHVHDIHWNRGNLPAGVAHPVIAMPIVIRRRLLGFTLFGSHRGGEAVDPDELKALESLMVGAAVAYDHLDSEALREENRRLREEQRLQANAV
ncbi:MAG: hypothetical protein M3160_08820 [Candidatus Eremiobacteraeota bacterium]|nr:hypothetical protein [Candidatus Eremiobacteraeota bacterium]